MGCGMLMYSRVKKRRVHVDALASLEYEKLSGEDEEDEVELTEAPPASWTATFSPSPTVIGEQQGHTMSHVVSNNGSGICSPTAAGIKSGSASPAVAAEPGTGGNPFGSSELVASHEDGLRAAGKPFGSSELDVSLEDGVHPEGNPFGSSELVASHEDGLDNAEEPGESPDDSQQPAED